MQGDWSRRLPMAVVQLLLVLLRVGDKLLQVVGPEVVTRDQHQGFIRKERHRGEIRHSVVKCCFVEPLALCEGPDVSNNKLIAVRYSLGHTASTDHAACPGDIFHNNGLPKVAANSISDDASYGVARAAG